MQSTGLDSKSESSKHHGQTGKHPMNRREFNIAADFQPAGLAGLSQCFAASNKTTAKTKTKTV
ncbi:hypothetical protein ABID21_002863 [Pseudorhizobium tarimense]|uniref:Uncharacterized protein n=1 Tax=Pseudorhizobium tarimense TaxID=1079109 RepID=A0ABV2H857_9HYPH|nr:hypothetical protein [Pseudorhizobium tarimense]MCJ8519852.1 hypothetical protein [Pseudorhizobium tarimense]